MAEYSSSSMEEQALMSVWSDGSEEEEEEEEEEAIDPNYNNRTYSSTYDDEQAIINSFISNIYTGPTISDIESALSLSSNLQTHHFQRLSSSSSSSSPCTSRFSILERSLNMRKINEDKYTLEIKCLGNGITDDGYKWRKYGQKSIKNSPNPRSYYRCTNPRCSAKKQVERSNEDPDTLIVTYEGLHLHFTYPYFVMGQPHQAHPPSKKSKATFYPDQAQKEAQESQLVYVGQKCIQETQEAQADITLYSSQDNMAQESIGPQGLLEDMVPLMIRNPN